MTDPTFGIDESLLLMDGQHPPMETIRPDVDRADDPPAAVGLAMGVTLGEGGMGVVRDGTQHSLRRSVAIKTLKPGRRSLKATRRLVQEARVMGALEHPNVVPVHDVATLDDAPAIVMKRIEGEVWTTVLPRQDLPERVEVLVQVCNAVAYAHSRGVLHRDLKPDNVMLGRFGEVYLLDWGIAVALHEGAPPDLPRAATEHQLAGTPAYMAPEMAMGDGARVGVHTDVYLLGALLYEVLTGGPPHMGHDARSILTTLSAFQPFFPAGAPGALAQLCAQAMALDPAARPRSAEAFRAGLQRWLRLRPTLALRDEALAEAARLGACADADEALRRFGAVRFGFQQVLRELPDDAEARAGLVAATATMVEQALAAGDAPGAHLLLRELTDPPPALAERVRAAVAAAGAEAERLRAVDAQLDPRLGQRTRLFFVLIFGCVWVFSPLVGWATGWPVRYPGGVYHTAIIAVLVSGLGLWAHESMTRSTVNRRILGILAALPIGQFGFILLGWLQQLDPLQTAAWVMAWWGALALTLSVAVDRRALPMTLGFATCSLVTAAHPAWFLPMAALANALFVTNAAWIWLPDAWDTLFDRVWPRRRG